MLKTYLTTALSIALFSCVTHASQESLDLNRTPTNSYIDETLALTEEENSSIDDDETPTFVISEAALRYYNRICNEPHRNFLREAYEDFHKKHKADTNE